VFLALADHSLVISFHGNHARSDKGAFGSTTSLRQQ